MWIFFPVGCTLTAKVNWQKKSNLAKNVLQCNETLFAKTSQHWEFLTCTHPGLPGSVATPTQPLAVFSLQQCYFSRTQQEPFWTGAEFAQWLVALEHFPHYYHCAETERITQVVVRLCTEHAGRCVFVASLFTLGPSNWEKGGLLLTQLEIEGGRDGEGSLRGTLFGVMGLAWFLSQLEMKSAETDSHILITLLLHV